jgi:two-component system sensor histidine kinase HydH
MNNENTAPAIPSRTAMPRVRPQRNVLRSGFRMLRWYSLTSLVAMATVAVLFAVIGSRFFAEETLQRDAVLTAQFIESMMETESQHWGFAPQASLAEFLDPKVDPTSRGFTAAQVKAARAEFYDHVRLLPDELLANLYARDLTIVWSTNPALIGRRDAENRDLREAFESQLMVARGHLAKDHGKKEQSFLTEPAQVYIENYIPLRSAAGEVVAVVEIYKEPQDLLAIIDRGQRLLWIASASAAIVVYLLSFGIVYRGHRQLMAQQQKLMENDRLVVVGELSSAIAHSLRNPLAAIRSSAELAAEEDNARTKKLAGDIVRQVDRMSRWIKDLLLYARPQNVTEESVSLHAVVADIVGEFAPQCAARGIVIEHTVSEDLPPVWGNASMIAQVLQSVLSNAVEAIASAGKICITASRDGNRVLLQVSDTGRGMNEAQRAAAFRPFSTSKANGLGVGLAMVRQIMERFGGEVEIASQENVGTDVFLNFRLA